jgi:ACR3 family arsenite transporter
VALNDASWSSPSRPSSALLLGLSAITVPWDTLLLSVVLYIVIPVIIAQVIRRVLASGGEAALERAFSQAPAVSLVALLATLVLLFGFQGEQIIAQPLDHRLLAVPILIQVYFNSGLAYLLNRAAGEAALRRGSVRPDRRQSNFFELAVAAAISLFGFNSGAALATVVGVLIEVPVMLSVVKIVKR